uniref:Uncharacterized protein n=1 Tax=Pygocentrus nattereri TaxID=42514 RepID=A0A3B4D2Y4_PYGNA
MLRPWVCPLTAPLCHLQISPLRMSWMCCTMRFIATEAGREGDQSANFTAFNFYQYHMIDYGALASQSQHHRETHRPLIQCFHSRFGATALYGLVFLCCSHLIQINYRIISGILTRETSYAVEGFQDWS